MLCYNSIRQVYDLLLKTLRIYRDDTVHLPAWAVSAMYKPMDMIRTKVGLARITY